MAHKQRDQINLQSPMNDVSHTYHPNFLLYDQSSKSEIPNINVNNHLRVLNRSKKKQHQRMYSHI